MNYRYPGPQSFGEKDESLFFGRRKETKALLDLILVQSLVVLFAKSGMGKTSLLQAGIIPKLRFTEYDPIVIRLNDPKVSLENQVLRRLTPNVSPNSTLWSEIVHYNQISNGTPLLIFDQFEEIFTLYSEGQREKFVSQLADVINGTLPESIRKQIGNKITKEHVVPSEIAILEQLPKVKIVLSIRSDLLHFLHLLSPEIPSILRNRFELLGLQPDQAREAIINPAKQTQASGDFASQPFALTSKALDQIINHLSQRKHSDYFESSQRVQIESFQLQLLCEYIERKVISEYPKVATSLILLTSHFFGGNEGIEEVLSRFYSNTLENITDLSQLSKAQRLLEDHLIK
ncbi:MAG: hypothetical protein KDC86_03795, partial [Saprospiraceae bacterium]|nr:hypothetical protein [Saprospiraceae bacterium]